jgi:RNA:NAD 2'-phosphotransferase (TPT1/KptA family)
MPRTIPATLSDFPCPEGYSLLSDELIATLLAEIDGYKPLKKQRGHPLAYLLRHGGVPTAMDTAGYFVFDEVVEALEGQRSRVDILHTIATNDKRRFALAMKDDVLVVRAQQAHSDELLEKIDPTLIFTLAQPGMTVVHRTTKEAHNAITQSGELRPMTRMLHFAPIEDEARLTRNHEEFPVRYVVDYTEEMAAQIPLWVAGNGVVLSYVPVPLSFARVE